MNRNIIRPGRPQRLLRFWRFLVGTLAGIAPLAIALAVFSESPDQLKSTLIWIGVGGIALYGVYIWLDRRAKKEEDFEEKQAL